LIVAAADWQRCG